MKRADIMTQRIVICILHKKGMIVWIRSNASDAGKLYTIFHPDAVALEKTFSVIAELKRLKWVYKKHA